MQAAGKMDILRIYLSIGLLDRIHRSVTRVSPVRNICHGRLAKLPLMGKGIRRDSRGLGTRIRV